MRICIYLQRKERIRTIPPTSWSWGRLSLLSQLWFWPGWGQFYLFCFCLLFRIKKILRIVKINTHVYIIQNWWWLIFYYLVQVYFLIKRKSITNKIGVIFLPLCSVVFMPRSNSGQEYDVYPWCLLTIFYISIKI